MSDETSFASLPSELQQKIFFEANNASTLLTSKKSKDETLASGMRVQKLHEELGELHVLKQDRHNLYTLHEKYLNNPTDSEVALYISLREPVWVKLLQEMVEGSPQTRQYPFREVPYWLLLAILRSRTTLMGVPIFKALPLYKVCKALYLYGNYDDVELVLNKVRQMVTEVSSMPGMNSTSLPISTVFTIIGISSARGAKAIAYIAGASVASQIREFANVFTGALICCKYISDGPTLRELPGLCRQDPEFRLCNCGVPENYAASTPHTVLEVPEEQPIGTPVVFYVNGFQQIFPDGTVVDGLPTPNQPPIPNNEEVVCVGGTCYRKDSLHPSEGGKKLSELRGLYPEDTFLPTKIPDYEFPWWIQTSLIESLLIRKYAPCVDAVNSIYVSPTNCQRMRFRTSYTLEDFLRELDEEMGKCSVRMRSSHVVQVAYRAGEPTIPSTIVPSRHDTGLYVKEMPELLVCDEIFNLLSSEVLEEVLREHPAYLFRDDLLHWLVDPKQRLGIIPERIRFALCLIACYTGKCEMLPLLYAKGMDLDKLRKACELGKSPTCLYALDRLAS